MRPQSIIYFEWLYLGSLVLAVLYELFLFDFLVSDLNADPTSIVVFGLAVGLSVLLWFLIARRASHNAKWFLVTITVLATMVWAYEVSHFGFDFWPIEILTIALDVGSVCFLFRPDATSWLKANRKAESGAEIFQ